MHLTTNANVEQQRTEISRLSENVSLLRKQIADLEMKLKDKESEIKERTKLADILSRDRAKQSEEVLNRLAAKLRVEYRDFLDAESMPMSVDLGENMRLQLKSIFDILKRMDLTSNKRCLHGCFTEALFWYRFWYH